MCRVSRSTAGGGWSTGRRCTPSAGAAARARSTWTRVWRSTPRCRASPSPATPARPSRSASPTPAAPSSPTRSPLQPLYYIVSNVRLGVVRVGRGRAGRAGGRPAPHRVHSVGRALALGLARPARVGAHSKQNKVGSVRLVSARLLTVRRFPLELHLIHTRQDGADPSLDTLAVVALLFQVSHHPTTPHCRSAAPHCR